MNAYQIHNSTSGQYLGTYLGESESDALDAMARDAGYADHAAAVEASGDDDDLTVTEIETEAYYVDGSDDDTFYVSCTGRVWLLGDDGGYAASDEVPELPGDARRTTDPRYLTPHSIHASDRWISSQVWDVFVGAQSVADFVGNCTGETDAEVDRYVEDCQTCEDVSQLGRHWVAGKLLEEIARHGAA
jgi:hypothetical protein